MNILKRIFKFGQAELHATIDQIENPVKMTEQGIRDMKADLESTLKAFAEVKAIARRNKSDLENCMSKANDYEQKAVLLLKAVKKGELKAEEGDRLAKKSLSIKAQQLERVSFLEKEKLKLDKSLEQLEGNVDTLKHNIQMWENELQTLKARAKVSETTLKVNKQLSQIDSSGTVSMLERMKDKVSQQEALSESYAEISNKNVSVDEEITSALSCKEFDLDKSLDTLKAQINK